MPVKIRIKGTDKYVTVNSGKNLWNAAGHAKAALKTSGIGFSSMRDIKEVYPQHPKLLEKRGWRERFKWDELSDILEIEEYKLEKPGALKDALALIKELREALWHADVEGTEAGLIAKAARFAKEHE